jgi:PEP-CTERM motif-containing protein/uncharacterized protein DUF4114
MKCWKLALMLALGAAFVLPAQAVVVTPTEPWDDTNPSDEMNFYEIYNAVYGTVFTTNSQLDALQADPDDIWSLVGSVGDVTATARFAGFTQEFGYYTDLGVGAVRTSLFTITDSGLLDGSDSATISEGGNFGFFDIAGGGAHEWFSESALNFLGEDHLVVYTTPDANTFLFGWEDLPFANNISDGDFNDLVVEVYLGSRSVIPEPTTMLLLGMGIAGMVATRMRRS